MEMTILDQERETIGLVIDITLPTTHTMAARGTAKVLQKLEKSVSEGHYYEAHQMYRTVANR